MTITMYLAALLPLRSTGILSFGLLPLLLLLLPVPGMSQPTGQELSQAIANHLVCHPLERFSEDDSEIAITSEDLCLALIYQNIGAQPLWVAPDGPTPKARLILGYLRDAGRHGLDPQEYKVDELDLLWNADDAAGLARLDTSLTFNLVKYIHDISYGRLKIHESDPELFAEAGNRKFNPLSAIQHVLAAPDLNRYLSSLPPQHHHYRSLQTALEHYRKLAASGGWPQLGEGESLRPGQEDQRIATVRKRLLITGELQQRDPVVDEQIYDAQLEAAVRLFQKQHGLTQDGIIGKKTRAAMNITAQQKVDIIRINMARWRWHAHDLGEKYILVNIASFNLKAYQDNNSIPALDFAVIVGEDQHQTPVFSDSVAYLDLNPFWNVTPSIAANEDLPSLRKDPEHLVKRHIRLFSSWQQDAVELDSTKIDWYSVTPGRMRGYKLRQDPGPWNALGKIKFVFPNRYSVYMHDTASPNLFQRTERDFSHGCIRVSDPLELAIFVLDGQDGGWTREKITEIYDQDTRKVIRLSSPVPVHITYQTTWVDKDGSIHFNNDIYARDQRLLSALIK